MSDMSSQDRETLASLGNEALALARSMFFSDAVMAIAITLMPFVASLFGQYYDLPLSMSVYAAAVAATGLSMGALWWYASYRHRLIDEHLDDRFVRARSMAQAVPLLFLVSIPFAFLSRTLTIAIWFTLPLVSFFILRRAGEAGKNRNRS